MQLLDPNPFVERVSVFEEDGSDELPVLEIPPVIPDFTSDDVWDVFSDFSGDFAEFSLTVEEFDGDALPDDLPRLVVSDDESLGDGEDEPSFNDNSADTAGSVPEVTNPFENPDPALAWRLANMPDDALLALLFAELLDLEPQEGLPQ